MSSSTNLRRPEHAAPPDIYYNSIEAKKYADNTRIINIQTQMTERCLELLALPKSDELQYHILDIGCGSGLSGGVISDSNIQWTGIDISLDMLNIAYNRDVLGDLLCCDIGDGLNFKSGIFDGCVSVSVIQWLCNADNSLHNPIHRMKKFFSSLYYSMKSSTRAIFQFYPESAQSIQLLQSAALHSGFTGGIVIDYPNSTKAKKYYLCLQTGGNTYSIPNGLDDNNNITTNTIQSNTTQSRNKALFVRPDRYNRNNKNNDRVGIKSIEWIHKKKQKQRALGKDVKRDSKYTGRSRGPKF